MSLVQRLKNSWDFLICCIQFLKKNPDLIVLPVLSLVAILVVVASLAGASFLEIDVLLQYYQTNIAILIIGLLLFYFLLSFVILYFNASLITCVIERMQGNKITVFQALFSTLKRTGPLLQWTFISATVCILINALERTHDIVGEILSTIFGFSWAITTYFVLPIMIVEDIGPITAFKHSITLIGKGWRKLLSANFILFLFVAVMIGVFYLVAYLFNETNQSLPVNIPIILGFLVLGVIISKAFNTIFNCALYLTISGRPLQGFDKTLLSELVVKK